MGAFLHLFYCEKLLKHALIISANKDAATVVESSHYMHEQIKNSELVVLAPSGHMSMMEQHEEFVEAVASFARRCTRSTYSSVN